MSGIKISALPPVAAALATDIFPIVQGGITSQVSLAQVQTLFGFPGGVLGMAQGGTGAVLVPDNGAIVYSTATSLALLASTPTANQVLLSGASSAPSWSSATYPASTTANELLFSSATNTITGLTTANNATLITSLTGVPSLSQILPSAVQTNITRLGAQAVDLNMNSHFIHNVTDPIQPQDAATKAYADLIAAGLNVLLAVYAASTVNLTATYAPGVGGIGATLTNTGTLAAFAIDGVSPPVNSRILIKNQTSTLQNGIYTLTTVGSGVVAWVLTRATDYDQPTEITPGDLVIVNNGTVNQQTSWVETATVTTVGVDPILFSQFTTTASGIVSSGLINQLAYYAANGTTVSGLPTLANAGLLTNGSGAPGWVASTGTGAPVLQSNPVINVPQIGQINDGANNLPVAFFGSTTSSVNTITILSTSTGLSPFIQFLGSDTNVGGTFQTKGSGSFTFTNGYGVAAGNYLILNGPAGGINYFTMTSGATTVKPILSVTGTDTNIGMTIDSKGTGGVAIKGVTDGSNAASGYVGEYFSSVVASSPGVAVSSGVAANVTSLSLTAGDWEVWGSVGYSCSGSGNTLIGWVSTTSATIPDLSLTSTMGVVTGGFLQSGSTAALASRRFNITSTTTIFLSGRCVGTAVLALFGSIYARRIR